MKVTHAEFPRDVESMACVNVRDDKYTLPVFCHLSLAATVTFPNDTAVVGVEPVLDFATRKSTLEKDTAVFVGLVIDTEYDIVVDVEDV